MPDLNYIIGMRVVTTSDDAALVHTQEQLERINKIPIITAQQTEEMQRASTAAVSVEEALARLTPQEKAAAAAAAERATAQRAAANADIEAAGAAKDAAAGAEDVGAASETAAQKMGRMESMLLRMAVRMAILMGLRAVFKFIVDGIKELADRGREIEQTTFLIDQFDGKMIRTEPHIRAFTEAMEAQGVSYKDTLSTLREIIPAAGSMGNAINGAKLAIDIASTGLMSYQQAGQLVRDLMEGKPSALKEVHDHFNISVGNTKDALARLYDLMGSHLETIADEGRAVDQLARKWDHFKEGVAQGILEMGAALKHLDIGSYLGPAGALTAMADKVADDAARAAKANAAAAAAKSQYGTPATGTGVGAGTPSGTAAARQKEAEAVQKLQQSYLDLGKNLEQVAVAELKAAEGENEIQAAAQKAIEASRSQFQLEASVLDAQRTRELSSAKLTAKAKESIEKEYQNKRLLMARQEAQKEAAIQNQAAAQIQSAHLKSIQLQGRQDTMAAQARQRQAQQEAAFYDRLDRTRLIKGQKYSAAELRNKQAVLIHLLRDENTTEQQKTLIEEQYAKIRVQLAEAEAKAKIDANLEVISSIIGSLGSMFGDSKAAAIAQGIINAYLAATNAGTKGDPYTTALRVAAALAATMAQVTAMENVKAPSFQTPTRGRGFDDPANDALVYEGSKKWARDQVGLMVGGFGAGWRDFMSMPLYFKGPLAGAASHISSTSNVTHNNQRPTTILNAQFLSPGQAKVGLKELDKDLVSGRLWRQRGIINRSVTKIGSKRAS